MSVIRPFDEPDLRDDFRLDPHHLGHLLRGHASAPMRGLAVREINEGALRNPELTQRVEHLAPQMRREPCSHLSSEPQLLPFVVAHQQRVDPLLRKTLERCLDLLLVAGFQDDNRPAQYQRPCAISFI